MKRYRNKTAIYLEISRWCEARRNLRLWLIWLNKIRKFYGVVFRSEPHSQTETCNTKILIISWYIYCEIVNGINCGKFNVHEYREMVDIRFHRSEKHKLYTLKSTRIFHYLVHVPTKEIKTRNIRLFWSFTCNWVISYPLQTRQLALSLSLKRAPFAGLHYILGSMSNTYEIENKIYSPNEDY